MWYIVSQKNPDEKYGILVGKEYSVGRRDCDITIENDMSISRRHASLQVEFPEADVGHPQRAAVLKFKDASKLGTMVGRDRVKGTECIVKNGDVLILGSAGISKYRAIYEPFVITSSTLDNDSKKMTKQNVHRLGGHVVNDWRKECSLLIMSTLSVTVKAICALVAQKPIVTAHYLLDLVKAMEQNIPGPDTSSYLPSLTESQLDPTKVSFQPNLKRSSLFRGKTFAFLLPKQFKRLSLAIELAGGTPILTEEGMEDGDELLVRTSTCVMAFEMADTSLNVSDSAREWMKHVGELLESHKRRPIQECEIGYAVVYCSTANHCNSVVPHNVPTQPLPPQSLSQMPLEESAPQHTQQRTEIPSSMKVKIEPTCISSDTRQRKRCRQDDETEDIAEPSIKQIRTRSPIPVKIKHEPITPKQNVNHRDLSEQSHQRRRSPKRVHKPDGEIPRRQLRSQSRSPSPSKEASRNPSPQACSNANKGKRNRKYSSSPPASPANSQDDNPFNEVHFGMKKKSKAKQPDTEKCFADSSPSSAKGKQTTGNKAEKDKSYNLFSNLDDDDTNSRHESKPVENRQTCEVVESLEFVPQGSSHRVKQELDMKHEPPSDQTTPRDGWLSTDRPIDGRANIDQDYVPEPDKPTNMIIIETKSLLSVRPRKSNKVAKETSEGGLFTYKGKKVNNFKKFRKLHATGLPQIIGGRDLVPHENKPCQAMDEWINEYTQVESQKNAMDEFENFEYEKKKKGRR